MELKIKKIRDNAIIPTIGSEKAAGIDLYACIDEPIVLMPNKRNQAIIPTGIACEFPKGYFGAIAVRSSVGIKRNIGLMNQLGVIDEDYRGEIMLGVYNFGENYQVINPGERLAQMILLPYVTYNIVETQTLTETERGEGGFGSTGK